VRINKNEADQPGNEISLNYWRNTHISEPAYMHMHTYTHVPHRSNW
jgi:hypothetical protein